MLICFVRRNKVMKSIGIVRNIDDLGRIVIPKELRKTMDLKVQDPIEIYVDEDKIIFTKYESGCIFCNELDNTFEFMGKTICESCYADMGN